MAHINEAEMPELPWHDMEEGTQKLRMIGMLDRIYNV